MKKFPLLGILLLLIPFVLFSQPSSQQSTKKKKKEKKEKKISIFELMAQDSSTTQMILTTDMNRVIEDKYSEKYLPAHLTYVSDGDTLLWEIGVAPRGKSRKKICDMPPLRLYFPKDDLKEAGLKKHNTLKLVTYCKNRASYNKYILKEYIAYKLFNIITDYSFDVKLVQLQYRDVNKKQSPIDKYAFIIENTDEMAARLKAKELNDYEMCRDSCNFFNYDLFSMFQYMISNTDWNLSMQHNVKIIREKKSKQIIPIPYDFDYSGFVNTDYSVPNPDYPQQADVRQRLYIGECTSLESMQLVADQFILHKQEVLDYCANFELLDKRSRKGMVKYLKQFYKTIENPKKLRKRCLQR